MTSAAKPVFELSPKRRALLDKLMNQTQPGSGTAARITRRPAEDRRPLSFAQQRLWFIHQLNPDSPFYNMHIAVRLTGALQHAALERSLNAVVARHESLRTT